jgi:hypothetical protein
VFTMLEVMTEIDIEICTAYLLKEWGKRYRKMFNFDYSFKGDEVEKIKQMVQCLGYETTFICLMGSIRFYNDYWRTENYKWLSVNQVHKWIGEEVFQMYENKEFKVKITYPKL